jgi:NAD(P)-dependent dehydrogenase (short-subunit alcohol dehydrogenase family)
MRAIEPRPVAVVTGASAGVGRATALALARNGYDVALLARGEAGLAAARTETESAGGRALAVVADVADFDAVEAAAESVESQLGEIEVWVNNAMTTVFAPLPDISAADFKRAVEVTFLGQVWGTKVALARMKPRDRGTIVNVGSALAHVGIPLQSAYCASKFACRGLFESARAELIHDRSRVRLAMVHLPAVNTPQFEWCKTVFSRSPQPVPPIYEPEVAAEAVLRAVRTGRPERVLGVWNRLLVLGAHAFPGFATHFAALGAWDEQMTDRPVHPGRRPNLHDPADSQHDYGTRGTFDDRSEGILTPSFVASLPRAGREAAVAAGATVRERLGTSRVMGRLSGDGSVDGHLRSRGDGARFSFRRDRRRERRGAGAELEESR